MVKARWQRAVKRYTDNRHLLLRLEYTIESNAKNFAHLLYKCRKQFHFMISYRINPSIEYILNGSTEACQVAPLSLERRMAPLLGSQELVYMPAAA